MAWATFCNLGCVRAPIGERWLLYRLLRRWREQGALLHETGVRGRIRPAGELVEERTKVAGWVWASNNSPSSAADGASMFRAASRAIMVSAADHLRRFTDIFVMLDGNKCYSDACVTLHPSLITPEDRTRAVGHVIKSLGSLIPGTRNELYPVTPSYGMPAFFSLERAAAPFFGIKAYGVHMNGYVEKGGKKYLWIGKRSSSKPTFPGMLDHLVAGGLPHGISCKKNIIKECQEEAGIPEHIANRAVPVGAVSYVDIDGQRYKRDILFCYDLKLPDDFVPENEDGEVDSFRLFPIDQVANIVRRTEFFKPNCCLVIIDFLFRHGFIGPDDSGYLELLQSLRSGDCS